MIGAARRVYLETRKKHDQLFNVWVMRPLAAGAVVILAKTPITPNQVTLLNLLVFVVAAGIWVAWPTQAGAIVGVVVLELSYLLDCADGMLARHKKIASKEGHLFDFFTDELKAVLLAGAIGVRLWETGGLGIDGAAWPARDARFLLAATVGVAVIASATSLTNFTRRPELTGKETPVEAHYETVGETKPRSLAGRLVALPMMLLRFLGHYPSHIWAWVAAGRLDVFFWIYVTINALYLGRGWLGLTLRFGRFR